MLALRAPVRSRVLRDSARHAFESPSSWLSPIVHHALIFSEHDVDDDVQVVNIHHAALIDIGIPGEIGNLCLAEHDVDDGIDVVDIHHTVAVDPSWARFLSRRCSNCCRFQPR